MTHQKRAIRLYSPEEEMELARESSDLRKAHLQWCKDRALAELNHDKTIAGASSAMVSFVSDTQKSWWDAHNDEHPFLFNWSHGVYPTLSAVGMMHAISGDREQMRRWIEGFN